MADNTTLNLGSGGDVIASDDVAGVKYQRVKLSFGADGSASDVVSTATTPLPVALSDTDNAVLDAIAASVAGTLTVASHAVTNAGTFVVQENGAALTALNLIDDCIYVDDADWTDSTSKHALVGGIYQSVEQSITDGDTGPIQVDANGRVKVSIEVDNVGIGGGTQYAVDAALGATPTGTAVIFARDDTLSALTPIEGDAIVGRVDANGAIWVHAVAGDAQKVDDAAFTPGTTSVVMVGFEFDDTTPDSVDEGDAGAARMSSRREVYTQIRDAAGNERGANVNAAGQVAVSQVATSGGTSIFRSLDLDETEEDVKASAGQVYWIHAMNLAATKRYLKFYNAAAASVIVGTTTPVLTFVLPTLGDTNGAGFYMSVPNGIAFSTAICVAATTGLADADTGAPAANDVVVNIGYA